MGATPTTARSCSAPSIVLGETADEARQRKARYTAALADNMNVRLAGMSYLTGIDFSKFDLDEPLPEIETNASRASFAAYLSGDGSRTLREMLLDPGSGGIDFVGTPDSVAAEIGETLQEIGGDGFVVADPLTRRAVCEITDGLAPALKHRGLMRASYGHKCFRDNLLAFLRACPLLRLASGAAGETVSWMNWPGFAAHGPIEGGSRGGKDQLAPSHSITSSARTSTTRSGVNLPFALSSSNRNGSDPRGWIAPFATMQSKWAARISSTQRVRRGKCEGDAEWPPRRLRCNAVSIECRWVIRAMYRRSCG